MALVKTTNPVKHDGVFYAVGDEFRVKLEVQAFRLEQLGVAEVLEPGDEPEEKAENEAPDYEKMKVTELKERLDEQGVEYDANAVKADLIALLQE